MGIHIYSQNTVTQARIVNPDDINVEKFSEQ